MFQEFLCKVEFGLGDGVFEHGQVAIAVGGILRFDTQNQYRLCVAGADESPAVFEIDAYAINCVDVVTVLKVLCDLRGNLEFDGFCAVAAKLRRGKGDGYIGQQLAESLVGVGEDFDQTAGCIQGIVEAEEAIVEEDMSAHFAGEMCVGFLDFGFDEAVSDAAHDGDAAVFGDIIKEGLGAFYFADDRCAGVFFQHVATEEDHEFVAPDHVAIFVNHADAVGIAVVGDAKITVFFFNGGDDVCQVFENGGICVVIGKGSVWFAEKFDDFAVGGIAQERGRHDSADAVARIDGDF